MMRSALRLASLFCYSIATMALASVLVAGATRIASASVVVACGNPIYVLQNPCSQGSPKCPQFQSCYLYTIDGEGICECSIAI